MERTAVVAKHLLAAKVVAADEVAKYETGKHFSFLPDAEHRINFPAEGYMNEKAAPASTVPLLFADAVKNVGKEVALAVERPLPQPVEPGVAPSLPWSQWKKWTWIEFQQASKELAQAFIKLGLEPFGTVTIFGFNAPEWVISWSAAMMCGAKNAGIYLTDTPEQVLYKVVHSDSAIIAVDTQVEFDNVISNLDKATCLKAIMAWGMDKLPELKRSDGSPCRALTFDGCLDLGRSQGSEAVDQRLAAVRPGHCGTLIYTSGTTGNPKACMLCHDNLLAECVPIATEEHGMAHTVAEEGRGRHISFLPLSHIAASLMDFVIPLYFAGRSPKKSVGVYFARPYDLKEMTLAARLQFVKPTTLFCVPRVYEKMQARMMEVGASITGIKKSLATWAKGKGLEYCRNRLVGGSQAKPFLYGLADKLVLSKAREALGLDKCRHFMTGAAPISTETLEYFGSLGMTICSVYGMSESAGVTTTNSVTRNIFGSIGYCPPGFEVEVFAVKDNGDKTPVPRVEPGQKVVPEDKQGEICFRGRHIMMGYMANPKLGPEHLKEMEEKNSSAIDAEGWMHSGDKGCIDNLGFFYITGRYKELIIGAGGENIAPVPVEDALKQACPALANAMMVGDKRKYNICLVTLLAQGATGQFPGTDDLAGAALAVNPKVTKVSQAIEDPAWQEYIKAGVAKTNSNPTVCQSNAWKIQKFAILPRDFSIETGELTATLKLRRQIAEEMWKDVIDKLYID